MPEGPKWPNLDTKIVLLVDLLPLNARMPTTLLRGRDWKAWAVHCLPASKNGWFEPTLLGSHLGSNHPFLDASKQCTKTAGTYQSSHCRVTQFTTKCDIGLSEIFVIETWSYCIIALHSCSSPVHYNYIIDENLLGFLQIGKHSQQIHKRERDLSKHKQKLDKLLLEKNNKWGKGSGLRSKDSGIECVHDISNIQIKVNTHDVDASVQHIYISISAWVYNR